MCKFGVIPIPIRRIKSSDIDILLAKGEFETIESEEIFKGASSYFIAAKKLHKTKLKGKAAKLLKRISIIFIVSLVCIGCDQGTKSLVSSSLPKNEIFSYLGDTVRIMYIENTGAFLGMGSSLPENIRFILFTVIAGLLLVGLFAYLVFSSSLDAITIFWFSLIFSGGASNLYDRAVNNGAVVDFLNIGVGGLRTGIFNISDMFIMAGLFMLIIASYRKPKASQDNL
ncbi:MAG: signal peptidase II [Ghiorsea sp.]|nr:signal peptidase II [Ghiorsea sp.]